MPSDPIGLDLTYQFVDPAWEALTGIGREVAVGRTVGDRFGPTDAEQTRDESRAVIEQQPPVTVEESSTLAGRASHVRITRFAILGDAGEVESIAGSPAE